MTDMLALRGIGRADTGYLTRLPATDAVASPAARQDSAAPVGTRGDDRGELPLP